MVVCFFILICLGFYFFISKKNINLEIEENVFCSLENNIQIKYPQIVGLDEEDEIMNDIILLDLKNFY